VTEKTEGKGRPTPKRSQKAKSYVAPPPTNRKEAAKALRARQAQERERVRTGSKRGDESAFLKRDKGPVRSYVRDVVDSQRSLGPALLPFMLFSVIVNFSGNQAVNSAAFLAMVAMIFVVGIDAVRLGRDIGKRLDERFGELEDRRKHVFYGLQRTTLIKKWRTPPAKVSLGDDV
jgi:hypothetical protein